jgi:Putative prokaryotic signal transducing protein
LDDAVCPRVAPWITPILPYFGRKAITEGTAGIRMIYSANLRDETRICPRMLPLGSKIAGHHFKSALVAESRIGEFMAEPVNPAGTQAPNPNEKLVKVFDSEQESEALVVKGLLESAGIESDLTSASMVQDAFPGLGGMVILVREGDEQRARNAISEQQNRALDETAEIQAVSEEPPPKA